MDVIKRAILFDGKAIVDVIDTTETVQEAINIHGLSDAAANSLGRVLSMAAFMSGNFKYKDNKLTIIVQGNGTGGKIVVCGDYGGKVRGYMENPKAMGASSKDVVGKDGYLSIIKDFNMKEPYNGLSQLVNGNIDIDFAYYFTTSEQLPSAISLGTKIKQGKCFKSAGIVVQPMPNCEEEIIVILEDIVSQMKDIASIIEEKGVDEFLDFYFGHFKMKVLDDIKPSYVCSCSRDRISKMLLSLGQKEANDIIKQEDKIEVGCQFCNKKYVFTQEDVEEIFKNGGDN